MWSLRFFQRFTGKGHIGQDTLSEYLDGRLRGGTLERVRRELEACATCREELDGLRGAAALLRALPVEAPARSFVMSAPPLPEPTTHRRPFALRAPTWAYAGAASVAVLALAALISIDALGQSEQDSLEFTAAPPVTRVTTPEAGESSAAIRTESAEGQPSGAAPSASSTPRAAPSDERRGLSPPAAAQASDEEAAATGTESTAATAMTAGDAEAPPDQSEDTDGPRPGETQRLFRATPEGAAGPVAEGATDDSGRFDKASETIEPASAPAPEPAALPEEVTLPPGGGFPWLRVLEYVTGAVFALSLAAWLLARMASRRRV